MLTTLLLTTLLALEPATQPANGMEGMPEMSPEDAAMMEAFMAAGQPGAEHEELAKMSGEWKATIYYQDPSMPEPMVSQGRSTCEMILGGRFLKDEFEGEMMGTPFKGINLTGYNNVTGEYQNVWMDEMATAIAVSTGTASEDGKTVTYNGKMADPMSGEMKPYKIVITHESDDAYLMEMYSPIDDSDELVKTFWISYERA